MPNKKHKKNSIQRNAGVTEPLKWVPVEYDEDDHPFFDECKKGSEPRLKFDQLKSQSANIKNKNDWREFVKKTRANRLSKEYMDQVKKDCRRKGIENPPIFWRLNLNGNYRMSLCPNFETGEFLTHLFNSGDHGHKPNQKGYSRVIISYLAKQKRLSLAACDDEKKPRRSRKRRGR